MPDWQHDLSNWWGDHWQSWSNPGMFAHWDSPAGGGGAGGFRQAGPVGLNTTPRTIAGHDSPSGQAYGPWLLPPTAAGAQPPKDSSIINRIMRAVDWNELRQIAETVLGPTSFQLGVCYGIVKGVVGMVTGLLDVLKMFVLEGLYERAHHPSLNLFDPSGLVTYGIAKGADCLFAAELQKAHDQCKALLSELEKIFKHPLDFLGKMGDEYVAKWNKYKSLMANPSLASQFQAGEMLGEVLLDVLLLILTVVDGVGLALKAAKYVAEIPELVRLAESLRGLKAARVGKGGGAVSELGEGADAAKGATQANQARQAEEISDAEDVAKSRMKYPDGIDPAEGSRLTKSIRSSLNIEGRNVAIAEANINGERQLLTGVSGKASPPGTVSAPTDPLFSTKPSGAMTRAFDSEVKILEDIAKDLPPDANGTISLYTERPPCLSCQSVIQQFQQRFPGINLNVTHGQ